MSLIGKFVAPWGIGAYPVEYSRPVHGPYDPSRYYGKPDPLSEVKVGQLASWLGRRSYHPFSMGRVLVRAYWRWQRKYLFVRHQTAAPFVQFCVMSMIAFYCFNYKTIQYHSHAKYH